VRYTHAYIVNYNIHDLLSKIIQAQVIYVYDLRGMLQLKITAAEFNVSNFTFSYILSNS